MGWPTELEVFTNLLFNSAFLLVNQKTLPFLGCFCSIQDLKKGMCVCRENTDSELQVQLVEGPGNSHVASYLQEHCAYFIQGPRQERSTLTLSHSQSMAGACSEPAYGNIRENASRQHERWVGEWLPENTG